MKENLRPGFKVIRAGFAPFGEVSPEAGLKGADSVLGARTPEGIEYVLHPAGLPIRACAWAVDCLIQGVILFALLITAGILDRMLGIWFLFLVIFALDWFYHMFFDIFSGGQSPGKRLLGIRVVRDDGAPVNPGASFLRNLLRFADTFLFLYLIAFICMLVSPAFRRIGDWVAGTLVVYVAGARISDRIASPATRKPDMPWLENVPVISPAGELGYEEKQALLMFARRYPLLGRARADEIAGIWTGRFKDSKTGLLIARNGAGPFFSAPGEDTEASNKENALSPSAFLLGMARGFDGAGGGTSAVSRKRWPPR